jgi:hypothetical protein
LIDELKQMLRDKKTKSGASINPQLAHEIAKHITILNEAAAQPETKKSIKGNQRGKMRVRPIRSQFVGVS